MLKEAIEELKKQIAETSEEEVEEVQEEVVEEPDEPEEKPEEKAEEPAKVEEKPDDAAFARMRREKAALEKQLRELKEPKQEEEADNPVESELKEIIKERTYSKAEREFLSMESDFKRTNPEYASVAAEYAQIIASSIKAQNPRLSEADLVDRTKKFVLEKAGGYLRDGFNPIEELYQEAKELGITGKSREKPEPEAKEERRPDLRKVAENRKRSAGTAGPAGEERGSLTKQSAAEMSVAEWKRLPADEKRRLMYGA